ncbi:hypothetical protein TCAL_02978 [Tigriopus californicus]|uniref:Glutathione S-transferase theta-1 n=1 Tax=Tigriopus californicus TaxID=6832 RepID=A0A553PS45_TIGCA|nr:glutathione S-transferase theta-1-like [Tigriopus californicus]TRY80481.1 hypothetical protein TCAL_02978 [Tigriopus californicus]
MTLKVLLDVMSQPSRAVLIFCRAAQIPHEFKPIRVAKLEHHGPEFVAMNPLKTVPIINDDGFVVKDSSAIMRYLSSTRADIPDHWYPRDPQGQAKIDEYLHWQHLNTRAGCAMYFRTKWLMPMLKQSPADEAKVESRLMTMEEALAKVQSVWLDEGRKKYLVGDAVSVADIMLCCEMEQPLVAGYDIRQKWPKLGEYMDRIKEDLHPHYEDVHKVLYGMYDKFGIKAKL